jgi:hypothetical protein
MQTTFWIDRNLGWNLERATRPVYVRVTSAPACPWSSRKRAQP